MPYRLVHIGFGNMIVAERIVAIIHPSSAPIKRLKEEAKEAGRLIDATQGRKTRAILVTDSNHIVLSAIQPETIVHRFEDGTRRCRSFLLLIFSVAAAVFRLSGMDADVVEYGCRLQDKERVGVQSFGASDELCEAVHLQQMLYAHGISGVKGDDAEGEGIDKRSLTP